MRRIIKQEMYLANLIKIRNNTLLRLSITSLKNLKSVKIRTIKSFMLLC